MAAGRDGVITLRIDKGTALAVVVKGGIGRDQDRCSAVFPFLPGIIVMSVSIAEIVKILHIDTHGLSQVRVYEGCHRAHVIDAGKLLLETVIVPQLSYHLAVDHGCAHSAEVHRNLIRLFMCKCCQNSLF